MNRERAKELLPVIKAYSEGKVIQCWSAPNWIDMDYPTFVENSEYRVKPEPLEMWVSKWEGTNFSYPRKCYPSKSECEQGNYGSGFIKAVKLIEVIE